MYNFLHAHDDYGDNAHSAARIHGYNLNLKGAADDKGTFDWLIDKLGLKKINISEFPKVLGKLGVTVTV